MKFGSNFGNDLTIERFCYVLTLYYTYTFTPAGIRSSCAKPGRGHVPSQNAY